MKTTLKEAKEICIKNINTKNVCPWCGRKIKPLKTVDNARNPTYRAGCNHGNKDGWGHFTHGVDLDIYKTAVKLVLDDATYRTIKRGSNFEYEYMEAVSYACNRILDIKRTQNNKPRYTKKGLKEMFNKYRKE